MLHCHFPRHYPGRGMLALCGRRKKTGKATITEDHGRGIFGGGRGLGILRVSDLLTQCALNKKYGFHIYNIVRLH